MKILAVDTSGFGGSIALADGAKLLEECQLPTEGRRHAQTLVAAVDDLLKRRQLPPSDIDAVAVSIGPGSFTGLRVGVVFAKTFAWANQTKLVAVNTLQAIAQRVSSHVPHVVAISDAQRNEVFINSYHWDKSTGIRQTKKDVAIQPISSAVEAVDANTVWTGPGLEKFGEHLAACNLADESVWQPTAASVATIGHVMLNQQQLADMHSLEPLYIRRSYAEENATLR